MKTSTLMAIFLVVQAVLIMGVFAAVSIENNAVVGEEEGTAVKASCCKKCTGTEPKKCEDPIGDLSRCKEASKCKTCAPVPGYNCYNKYMCNEYKCNDDFNGTCCNEN